MAVKAHDLRIAELLSLDAELECISTGHRVTEGPIWNPDGQFLLFSDILGSRRWRWDESAGPRQVADETHKANGMTLDAERRLLVCEHSTSSLVRLDNQGTGAGREVLATHYMDDELNSPNDVVVHSSGAIYFSDPGYGRMSGYGLSRPQQLGFQGVFRLSPGERELELVADDFEQPNGLCFSPDETLMYIDDTPRAHVRVFDVDADGRLSNGRVFAEGIGTGVLADHGDVDGMKCDERGNVWVTGPEGVWVFAPDGRQLGVVEIPAGMGNLHWGGPDWSWLFVTATTSVYRIRTKVRGRAEPFMGR